MHNKNTVKAEENWKRLNSEAEKAIREKNYRVLSGIYFEMALQRHKEGKASLEIQLQSTRMDLYAYRNDGVAKKVKILADVGCKECRKHNELILDIEDALEKMPIPVKQCEHKINKKAPDGWCRCSYLPIID